MQPIHNVHERLIQASPAQVSSWLDRAWSGGQDDVFPRDKLATWRETHDGSGFPVGTRFGHATLRFQLRHWDGARWEAEVRSSSLRGWHGFTVEPEGSATRLRHVLEVEPRGAMMWKWPLIVRPLHDWAVEAAFDRLEEALTTGRPPEVTPRRMRPYARLIYALADRLGHGALSGAPSGAPGNWGATDQEMRAAYPCDALLQPPDERLFRAVTVAAAPELVFRWLCQLRIAPYSYDLIDNWGRRSPRTRTPSLEALEPGQKMMRIFDLESFEPGESITLRVTDAGARRAFGDVVCTYAVRPGPTTNASRLVCKLLVRTPRSLLGRATRRLLPWGDLIMMRKQLLTLKALSEREARNA